MNIDGSAFLFDNIKLKWDEDIKIDSKEIIKKDSFFINIYMYDITLPPVLRPFPGKRLSFTINNSLQFVNTTKGAWDIDYVLEKRNNHYLPEKKITCTFKDKENNLWFSTLGEGVFKLTSQKVKTFQFSNDLNKGNEIFSLIEFNNGVLAGMEASKALYIDNLLSSTEYNYSNNETKARISSGTNRLYSMIKISNAVTLLGFDNLIVKLDKQVPSFKYINPVKSIAKINNEFVIVGTSAYALKMRTKDLQIVDTIWRERCTKVFYQNDKYYIGTLQGLYEINLDKSYNYLGKLTAALKRRITDIKGSTTGSLWIATSDNGIVEYKNGKIIRIITDSSGLSSNICKTIFVNGNSIWVGTDKGINKINIDNEKYNVIKYTTSDGLPSNVINALYIKDSIVWVGSPAGLTYFSENSISNSSMCNLKMLAVYVAGKEVKADTILQLSYQNNNINFEYAGISFKSGGEIVYYYKLTGLDDKWNTTTQNNLDYKSLSAGDYSLALYAVNKYGIKSNTITIQFFVKAPFWKTAWFILLSFSAVLGIIILYLNYRNKKTKQRLLEKNIFQKQFAALEQQALQAQMNPHFIFNCLNSIQQYILTNDKEKANEYLTDFASLIRQTLNISAEKSITVAEEASYLKNI